eukprot:2286881-Rhodomonas_salina.3
MYSTWLVSHGRSWLNLAAPSNMLLICSTRPVFQPPIGMSKASAFLNIPDSEIACRGQQRYSIGPIRVAICRFVS